MNLRSPLRISLTALVFGALVSMASPALGGEPVEPSDAQLELNMAAVEASRAGDPKKAIDLFKASLALGELNVTWLNLGRAYASLGMCAAARDAYIKVNDSPQTRNPTPAQVAEILDGFNAELNTSCGGAVTFVCQPRGVEISVDGLTMDCPDEPLALAPGGHVVTFATPEGIVERDFSLSEGETLQLVLNTEGIDPSIVNNSDGPSTVAIVGWSTLGVGAATLVAALVVDTVLTGAKIDDLELSAENNDWPAHDALSSEIETLQLTSIILYAAGGVITAAGLTALVLEWTGTFEEPTGSASAWITPDGAGLVWHGRW